MTTFVWIPFGKAARCLRDYCHSSGSQCLHHTQSHALNASPYLRKISLEGEASARSVSVCILISWGSRIHRIFLLLLLLKELPASHNLLLKPFGTGKGGEKGTQLPTQLTHFVHAALFTITSSSCHNKPSGKVCSQAEPSYALSLSERPSLCPYHI